MIAESRRGIEANTSIDQGRRRRLPKPGLAAALSELPSGVVSVLSN
jgi:hypothetical protein